jgi:hypothetical protein
MVKTRICVVVLLLAAGLGVFVSCDKPKTVLQIDIPEAGYYPVDVVRWFKVTDPEGGPDLWFSYADDATVECRITYFQPGTGVPSYPTANVLHLERYTITWQPDIAQAKIPSLTGTVGVYITASLTGEYTTVPILVMPAVCKDTVSAFGPLIIDPEGNVYTGDQILAKGRVKFEGTDIMTGAAVTGEATISAAFADYWPDPNKAH